MSTAQPLKGCAVAVTRALPAARETALHLKELGATAILSPVLVVRSRPLPIDTVRDVQAVIVTSRNGARRLAELDVARDFPVFAVGMRTAEIARRAGMKDVTSADGDGIALARLIATRLNPGDGALLHLRGRDVAGSLNEVARLAGFEWREAVAYAAEFADTLSTELIGALEAGTLDAALFHSARGASAFGELIDRYGLTLAVRPVIAVALSAAARTPTASLPFAARYACDQPNEGALLACLVANLRR